MKVRVFNNIKFFSGIFLLILNAGIWINGLFINRERGMDIIIAIPLLVTGAFLLLKWFRNTGTHLKSQRWKFILNVYLINYAVLYFIYMLADIIFSDAIDFLTMPGIMLPLLLGLFVMGFILSWKNEHYAGIFFLLWYFLALFSQIEYGEIRDRGPYILIGITIFIHGILYLVYYYRIKEEK
ncbi:MAG: hypothetical protein MUF36_05345 [Bacteroidales bacterium]|jgi:hypothetical protein|nr:hypothetical protein [Bacteroidales bacterium]